MFDTRLAIAGLAGLAAYAFWRSRQPAMVAPAPVIDPRTVYAPGSAITVTVSRPTQPSAPTGRCPKTEGDIRADVREFVARNPTWSLEVGKAVAYLRQMPIPCWSVVTDELLKINPAAQSRVMLILQTARSA